MKMIAKELSAVSDDLKELISFRFDEVSPKHADFVNAICSEIDDLADRIRRNEGLTMSVQRVSDGQETAVKVLMSDHEAMEAIRKEIAEKLGKLGKKRKIEVKVEK
jgi:hypothetical protein